MLRQGNCTDPYAGPPAINIRWTTVSAKCNNGALPNQLMNTSYHGFRAAHWHRVLAECQDRGPCRMGHLLQPGNRQRVFRPGAQYRRPRHPHFEPGDTESLLQQLRSRAAAAPRPTCRRPSLMPCRVDHHTTYAMQYLFNIQRQLTPELGARGRATWAAQSRHLQGFQDVNQSIPGHGRQRCIARAVSRFQQHPVCA